MFNVHSSYSVRVVKVIWKVVVKAEGLKHWIVDGMDWLLGINKTLWIS